MWPDRKLKNIRLPRLRTSYLRASIEHERRNFPPLLEPSRAPGHLPENIRISSFRHGFPFPVYCNLIILIVLQRNKVQNTTSSEYKLYVRLKLEGRSRSVINDGRIQNMDPGPWTTHVDPVHGSPLTNFRRHILPVNIIKDGLRTKYKIQIKYGVQYLIHRLRTFYVIEVLCFYHH